MNKNVVTVIVPHFGSDVVRAYLISLAHTNDSEVKKIESKTQKNKVTFEFTFPNGREWAQKQFVSSLNLIFNKDYLTFTTQTLPQFESELEELAYRIKHFDSTYEFSDDDRVYRSGYASEQKIKQMIKDLESKHPIEIATLKNLFKKA